MTIKQLILDVMKPHKPNMVEYARSLMKLECVQGVDITMLEVDKEVENIELKLVGKALDFDLITDEIKELAGAIHSVDKVVAGKINDKS